MKNIFLALVLTFLILPLRAQYFEAGGMLGVSNYLGDLSNNSRSVYLQETQLALGILGRYNFNDFFSLRLSGNLATVSGADENAPLEEARLRGLNFRSRILEGGLTAEFNILGYQPYNFYRPFSPYLFVGVSVVSFRPEAFYQNQWVDLQPLGTEGQGLPGFEAPYSQVAVSIPFGIGFKYAISDKLNAGFELGARRMFTDYLDDVSGSYVSTAALLEGGNELAAVLGNPTDLAAGTARGDTNPADWFFIAGISLSYNFMDNGLSGNRSRNKRRQGCQTF